MKSPAVLLTYSFVGVFTLQFVSAIPTLFDQLNEVQVTDCVTSSGIEMAEIDKITPNTDTVTENMMCFVKCLAEKAKYVNSDGTVNMEILKKRPMGSDDAEMNKKFDECMEKVDKIKTCLDMQSIHECMKG